tara:strand:- start:1767 stop:3320 length:1554 start_codon:yes stop_codon:yes gene_type:complete
MKVLSLFDGMSCGQIALDQLGIPVETYYASEIDKYAIQVTQANYPNTVQVGDVTNLDPKDFADVDLIMGGSPCQGFSFAGKQLAFDDPRSALFFEFIRLLKAIKPRYFLLENVRMKKEFLDIISQEVSKCYPEIAFGIEPILINSSLLSAQSRQRYYWTNIPNIQQPEDRGIVLRDILEDDYESERDKSYCIDANYFKGASVEQYKKKSRRQLVNKPKKAYDIPREILKDNERQRRVYDPSGKSPTILGRSDSPKITTPKQDKQFVSKEAIERYVQDKDSEFNDTYNKRTVKGDKSTTIRPNNNTANMWVNEKAIRESKPKQVGSIKDGGQGNRIYSQDGKSSTLSAQSGGTAGSGNTLVETKPKQVGMAADIKGHDILRRVYSPEGKSPTLNSMGGGNREPKVVVQSYREVRTDEAKKMRRMVRQKTGKDHTPYRAKKLEPRKDGKVGTVTPSLNKDHEISIEKEDLTWRKLTPLECERLQTVPDNYTNHVSNTQRYKMLGNGWTVEVIKHILKNV